jgi:hypothetical protein
MTNQDTRNSTKHIYNIRKSASIAFFYCRIKNNEISPRDISSFRSSVFRRIVSIAN